MVVAHDVKRMLLEQGSITRILWFSAIVLLSIAPERAVAQGATVADSLRTPIRFPMGVARSPGASQALRAASAFNVTQHASSLRRHIVIGAGIGAAAGAVFSLVMIVQHGGEESFIPPVVLVGVPVLVGAGAGALIGYFVHLTKR